MGDRALPEDALSAGLLICGADSPYPAFSDFVRSYPNMLAMMEKFARDARLV